MNGQKAETLFLNESFEELRKIDPETLLDIFLETINIEFQKHIAVAIIKAKSAKIKSEYKGCLVYFLLNRKEHNLSSVLKHFFSDTYIEKEFLKDFYRANVQNEFLRRVIDINDVLDIEKEIPVLSEKDSVEFSKLLEDKSLHIIKRVGLACVNNIQNEARFLFVELREFLDSLSLYKLAELRKGSYLKENPLIYDFWETVGYVEMYPEEPDELLQLLILRSKILPYYPTIKVGSINTEKKHVFYLENPDLPSAVSVFIRDSAFSDEMKVSAFMSLEWHSCQSHICELLANISMKSALNLYCNRRFNYYGEYEEYIFDKMLERLKFPKYFNHDEPGIVEWFSSLDECAQSNIFTEATIHVKELLLGCD